MRESRGGKEKEELATTYAPALGAVPSALAGLTTLFGMGKGDPRRYGHQQNFEQRFEALRHKRIKKEEKSKGDRCIGTTKTLRTISTAKLRALLPLHQQPIEVVIFHRPLKKPHLEVGFALRCFQRLSLPYLATRRCGWRHNR